MVFIRFVNGIVDPAQKGVFASSVVSIAESLGLPSWFVDLRHAGTHDHLPSVSILRSGCLQALQWLNDTYWVQQQLYMKDTFSEVKELLSTFESTEDLSQFHRIFQYHGCVVQTSDIKADGSRSYAQIFGRGMSKESESIVCDALKFHLICRILLIDCLKKQGKDSKPYFPFLNFMAKLSSADPQPSTSSDSTAETTKLPTQTPEEMSAEIQLLHSRIEAVRRHQQQQQEKLGDQEEDDGEADVEMQDAGGEQESKGIWRLATDMEWKRAPLGCLPGKGVPELGLPLEWDVEGFVQPPQPQPQPKPQPQPNPRPENIQDFHETLPETNGYNDGEPHHDKGLTTQQLSHETEEPATPEYVDDGAEITPLFPFQSKKRFADLTDSERTDIAKRVKML
ncbi:Ribosomal biogenesis protein las1l [Phlyctochytrium planicorne]|nr:Ribosomal biogenesis protein las1l [Phlyctochytrium planicorne]